MFQNPYFQAPQHQQSPALSNRPSVQDIMNKYRSSEIIEKRPNEMLLDSINDVLISNMKTHQTIQSVHEYVFINPIPPNFDAQAASKKEQNNRLTFGDDYAPHVQNKMLTENDLYADMSQLRDKVTSMLQKYSVQLKSDQDKKMIKQQLQNDAQQVAVEYTQIIDKFNNPDLSAISIAESTMPQKKEQELTLMFNLVEEFLYKFKNLSQNQQAQSQMLKSKFKHEQQSSLSQNQFSQQHLQQQQLQYQSSKSPQNQLPYSSNGTQMSQKFNQLNSPSQGRNSTQAVKVKAQHQLAQYRQTEPVQTIQHFQQDLKPSEPFKPLDLTIMHQFPKMEDSFYDSKQITLQRTNQKLEQLKQKLHEELQKENMPYTQKILMEMIHNLTTIIDTKDHQLVKTVIYKIESGIQQLNTSKEGSMQLYKYLNKAIMHSKMKSDLYTQRSSLPIMTHASTFATPPKAIPGVNQFQQSSGQRQSTKVNEIILKHKSSEGTTPQMHSLPRSSEIQSMRQSDQHQSLKRQFFDIALTKKNQLPANHIGRNLMVTDLYDEYVSQGYKDMYVFLQQKFGV